MSNLSKKLKLELINKAINENISAINIIKNQIKTIENIYKKIIVINKNKIKILICGNGEYSADAQYFASELVGRYEKNKHEFAAISLTTDYSELTAILYVYGF